MKYSTEKYSELLEGRLPTTTLEFELCDRLIELQEQLDIPVVSVAKRKVCVNCNDHEQSAGSEYCGECIDNIIH